MIPRVAAARRREPRAPSLESAHLAQGSAPSIAQIIGPYNSGTCLLFNYVHHLTAVEAHYHSVFAKHSIPPNYRWTESVAWPPDNDSPPLEQLTNTLLVAMVRQPEAWLSSMLRNPYDVHFATDDERPSSRLRSPVEYDGQRYADLAELWNVYYRAYADHLERYGLVYQRLEDLVEDPHQVANRLCDIAGPRPRVERASSVERIRRQPAKDHDGYCFAGEAARRRYEPNNLIELWSDDDLNYIDRRIDRGLRDRFGYPRLSAVRAGNQATGEDTAGRSRAPAAATETQPASSTRTERIFVALAAYREPELVDTIESCLHMSDRPDLLRFGVCLQHDASLPGAGPDCLDRIVDQADVDVISMPSHRSRGGCWARHRTQGLYRGEEYTLQCDAHSRLEPGWDTTLIDAMDELPSDRPLITGFPPLYRVEDGIDVFPGSVDDPVPVTVIDAWYEEGWIHHPTRAARPDDTPSPRRARVISGAFVFTTGDWNVNVRQDPEHLFTGEEFALTLRSFTHGYDLWNPPKRVIWHRLHPTSNPKYITDDPDGRQARRHLRAMQRLRTLLRGDPDRILEPYSLGRARTLEEFRLYSGLDHRTFEIHDDARAGYAPNPLTITD